MSKDTNEKIQEAYENVFLNELNEQKWDLYADGKKVNQKPMDDAGTKALKSFFKKYGVKDIKIEKVDEDAFLKEQNFECECGNKMASSWKDKAKCKECGKEMAIKGH